MTGGRTRARGPLFVAFATTSWALSGGCALFTDLNSNPYRSDEAGAGEAGTCTGDAGCPSLLIACLSAAECHQTGQVCCLAPTSLTSAAVACVAPSACSGQGSLSYQLCATATDCPGAGSCIAQQCALGGASLMLHACTTIPTCTTP